MYAELKKLLFPYRTHLEEEIDYLKGQLAQKQRRVDEMQEVLSMAVRLGSKPKQVAVSIPIKPKGWDEYRDFRRRYGTEESTETEGAVAEAGKDGAESDAAPI